MDNPVSGLLVEFIEKKIKAYNPRPRAGTPKGDSIDYPVDKYAASLWALTKIGQKEIAKKAGCNYRSLLTWRGQADFKQQVERNGKEFSSELIDVLRKRVNIEGQGDIHNFIRIAAESKDLSKIDLSQNECADIDLYEDFLMAIIVRDIEQITKRFANSPELIQNFAAYFIFPVFQKLLRLFAAKTANSEYKKVMEEDWIAIGTTIISPIFGQFLDDYVIKKLLIVDKSQKTVASLMHLINFLGGLNK
jgi:hypothetical protein